MFASAQTDEGACQLIRFPASPERRSRAVPLPRLLKRLDAAQAAGDTAAAEALIAAIYKRCDASTVSNTREGATS